MVKEILKQHCKQEQNISLNIFEEILYTIKALICHLIGNEKNQSYYEGEYTNDIVEVCDINFSGKYFDGEYTREDWTTISVPMGIKRWFLVYEDNSDI